MLLYHSLSKTATGHAPTGATRDNIGMIKSFVGDAIQIKASGGIRELETLIDLYRLGATRFGVGATSAVGIMDEMQSTGKGEGDL